MRHGKVFGSLLALLGLFAVVVAAPPLAAGAAAAPGAWGPVVNLSRPAPDTFGPDLAVDPRGDTVAIWNGGEGARSSLMLARRRAGGAWSAPRRVPGTRGVMESEVAFAGDGDLVVVWTVGRLVRAVRQSRGGSWGKPATLHRTAAGVHGTIPAYLELATNARGRAVVAWETMDDDQDSTYANSRVQAATGSASGPWGAVRTLSAEGSYAIRAQAVVSSAGRVTVVWDEAVGRRTRVMSASRSVGKAWESSSPLSRWQRRYGSPHIAVAPSGELAVAWVSGDARLSRIALRRWAPRSGWGATSAVPGPRTDVWWIDLGMDGAGTVTVGWTDGAQAVWSAEQAPAGHWTRARVAPRGSVFYELQVVVNRAGDAVIGWNGQARAGRHTVQAAYRSRSGPWGPATALSSPQGDAGGIAVGLAGDGSATAAWAFARRNGAPSRVQTRFLPAR
jgi:hypothetical protein